MLKNSQHTEEAKRKMSNARKGKIPKNFILFQEKGHEVCRKRKGQDHPRWKGDNVGYHALHSWIRRCLGKLSKCSQCGTTQAKRFEWANISGKYKRDLLDWRRLCVSCHRKEGYRRGEYTPRKGKRIIVVLDG